MAHRLQHGAQSTPTYSGGFNRPGPGCSKYLSKQASAAFAALVPFIPPLARAVSDMTVQLLNMETRFTATVRYLPSEDPFFSQVPPLSIGQSVCGL